MIIKDSGLIKTGTTLFDLLKKDEMGLSKALAFVFSKESNALFSFLRAIGVHVSNTENNFRRISIAVEIAREQGRTDIEIFLPGKFHVIIESKVHSNTVHTQRTQYLSSFHDVPQKIMCFIASLHDYKKSHADGIMTQNIGWIDVVNILDTNELSGKKIIKEFISFAKKGFLMLEQKEILIQDVGENSEIERFKEYSMYRRNRIFGSPLYFAPYFTRKANQPEGEGISYLSKILGILTINSSEITRYRDDLFVFSESSEKVDLWVKGIQSDAEDQEYTYFFLDNPIVLPRPLLKDGGIAPGRGKDWIAGMIPKNRNVTFEKFIEKLIESYSLKDVD